MVYHECINPLRIAPSEPCSYVRLRSTKDLVSALSGTRRHEPIRRNSTLQSEGRQFDSDTRLGLWAAALRVDASAADRHEATRVDVTGSRRTALLSRNSPRDVVEFDRWVSRSAALRIDRTSIGASAEAFPFRVQQPHVGLEGGRCRASAADRDAPTVLLRRIGGSRDAHRRPVETRRCPNLRDCS